MLPPGQWALTWPVSGLASLWLDLVKALSRPSFSFDLRTAWLGCCPISIQGRAFMFPAFPGEVASRY